MTQTRKKLTFMARLLAFAGLLSAVFLFASAPSALAQDNLCDSPEGSWLYTVTIPIPGADPIVFKGVETYAAGGGYSEADLLSVAPGYLATAGHGAWKSTGKRTFLLTYKNLTYDATGNGTGSSRVRQTTRISQDGKSYSGSGDFYYYYPDGSVMSNGTFTITAKRILVEQPE